MTENKIKYNSYENSFYINDDEGISQIIAPELIIEIINDYEKEIVKLNKHFDEKIKLEKENEQLKQSYKEFEDECQSTFNAMNRKQNDLYRKNFKLKEENEQLKQQLKTKYIVNKQYEELQKLKDENKELQEGLKHHEETILCYRIQVRELYKDIAKIKKNGENDWKN